MAIKKKTAPKKKAGAKKKAARKKASPGLLTKGKDQPLTIFEDLFCIQYLKDLNQGKAYQRARTLIPELKPVADNTARTEAGKLFHKATVQARITELRDKLMERQEVTLERITQEFAKLAFLDPADLYDDHGNPLPISSMGAAARAAITGVKVSVIKGKSKDDDDIEVREIQIASKKGALDSLTRMLGGFKDTVAVEKTVRVVHLEGKKPHA